QPAGSRQLAQAGREPAQVLQIPEIAPEHDHARRRVGREIALPGVGQPVGGEADHHASCDAALGVHGGWNLRMGGSRVKSARTVPNDQEEVTWRHREWDERQPLGRRIRQLPAAQTNSRAYTRQLMPYTYLILIES